MAEAIYLCRIDEIVQPGEDVDRQTMVFAQIVKSLGYVLEPDKEHYQLWARPPQDKVEIWHRRIYLCLQAHLAPGDPARIRQRMDVLERILRRLGWLMAAGEDGKVHEIWAIRKHPAASASTFLFALLAWIENSLRWRPEPIPGDKTGGWRAPFDDRQIEFHVTEMAHGDWRLSILEPLDRKLARALGSYFERRDSEFVFHDDGYAVTDFRGCDLNRGFPGVEEGKA